MGQRLQLYPGFLQCSGEEYYIECDAVNRGAEVWISIAGHVFQAKARRKRIISISEVEVRKCPFEIHEGLSIHATVAVGDNFQHLAANNEIILKLLEENGLMAIEIWERAIFSKRRNIIRQLNGIDSIREQRIIFHEWLIEQIPEFDFELDEEYDLGTTEALLKLQCFSLPSIIQFKIDCAFFIPSTYFPEQGDQKYEEKGLSLLINGYYIGRDLVMRHLIESTTKSLEYIQIIYGEPGTRIDIERTGSHVIWKGDELWGEKGYKDSSWNTPGNFDFSLGPRVVFEKDQYDRSITETAKLLEKFRPEIIEYGHNLAHWNCDFNFPE